MVVGLDLGDKESHWGAINTADGELRDGTVAMTHDAIASWVLCAPRSRVVMEAGTHAFWVARLLLALGHQAVVVPSDALVRGRGRRRKNKNDDRDKYGLRDIGLDMEHKPIQTIWVRPAEYQSDLTLMRARAAVVRTRSTIGTSVRGLVKSLGERIGKHTVESLPKFARLELSADTVRMVDPMLLTLEMMNSQIKAYDQQIEAYLARRPESVRLRGPKGVGPAIVGGYMAIIGSPERFKESRIVACYLGLAPWQHQSGEHDPQLGISKAGSNMGRWLMIQGAHYVLGPFGEDSDLRRWGLKLAGDGKNKARKRKAVVAVARKLAVLLHHLWVSGEEYEPLRNANRAAAKAALAQNAVPTNP